MNIIKVAFVLTYAKRIFGQDITSQNDYIINGFPVESGQYPFMVYLNWKNHQCGGVIIDPIHILTAAHCMVDVDDDFSTLDIVGGTIKRKYKEDKDAVIMKMRNFYVHPYYRERTFENDIALIQLDEYLPEHNERLKRIEKISEGGTPEGTLCIVLGWGAEDDQGTELSTTLNGLFVPVINDNRCFELYKLLYPIVRYGMMCAGFEDGGSDSCVGDSGGPLVCDGNTLVGMVSWGIGCAVEALPRIYTNVSCYTGWLQDTLAESYNELRGRHVL